MEIMEKLQIYFELVDDKRHKSYINYNLKDILFMLICSLLCGLKDTEEMEIFGEERAEFFRRHTEMKQIPCGKTLRNILAIIDPNQLELCLHGIFRNVFGGLYGITWTN